jgi:hypothetical protein
MSNEVDSIAIDLVGRSICDSVAPAGRNDPSGASYRSPGFAARTVQAKATASTEASALGCA